MYLILGGIALSAVIGFSTGWTINGWKHDAAAKVEAVAHVKEIKRRDRESRKLTKQYQEAAANTRVVYRTITKKVENETSNRVCLDAGAVGLWNSAVWGLPSAAPGTAEAAGGTDTATDRQVLNNATENLEQYKECRDQLNALIDWHDQNP